MRLDFAPLANAFQRLSSRERTLVGLAAGAMAVILLYVLVWQPIEEARVQLLRRIQVKRQDLIELQEMRTTYLDLLNQFELRLHVIEKADPHFALFPHIEATVSQVLGGRDKIASMNPQNKDLGGSYREESVEVKLNGVSLQQLVDLMYHIEKGAQPLRMTRLSIKQRAREQQAFDVIATVAMLKSPDANKPPDKPVEQPPQSAPADAPRPPAAPGNT